MLFQFFIIILNKIPCLLVIFLQAYYVKSLHSMLGVGFEPTRANTRDLKSPPLDHSGIQAHGTVIVIIILLIIFLLFNDL